MGRKWLTRSGAWGAGMITKAFCTYTIIILRQDKRLRDHRGELDCPMWSTVTQIARVSGVNRAGGIRLRELGREAEGGERRGGGLVAGQERGYGGDLVAVQGQDVDHVCQVAARLGIEQVARHRQLAVGRHHPVTPAHRQGVADQPRAERLVALEPVDVRRHAPGGVLRQEPEQRVDVARLEGGRVPAGEVRHRAVAEGAQGLELTALRQRGGRGRAGPLQGAGHRGDRGVELKRGLGGGEAEHVTENEHRALQRRQFLEQDHERDLDALPLLVAGLGGRRAARLATGQGTARARSGR